MFDANVATIILSETLEKSSFIDEPIFFSDSVKPSCC